MFKQSKYDYEDKALKNAIHNADKESIQYLGEAHFPTELLTAADYTAAARYSANALRTGKPKPGRDKQIMLEKKGLMGELILCDLFEQDPDAEVEPLLCLHQDKKPDLIYKGVRFDAKTEMTTDGHVYINVQQHKNNIKRPDYYIIFAIDLVSLKAHLFSLPVALVNSWEVVETPEAWKSYYKKRVSEFMKLVPPQADPVLH